ncbi:MULTISPECIES: hypothetical protein [unclassified Knoellia]|uniref:hypothetical protein n=1 Tax=Knoellia altitudinis TaxID=3404795 RepID=UPI003615D1FB
MAKRSIQGYVELASGLGEMTKGAAKDAAAELVSLTNADLSPKKVTKQATKLADDLIAAANTNRRNLVSLVRSEVDRAVRRLDVPGLQQELSTVTDTVHALRAQVEDLASTLSGRSARTVPGAAFSPADVVGTAGAVAHDTVAVAGAATTPSRRPARSALKKATPAEKSAPARKASSAGTSAPTKQASPAKKASTAKRTTATKSAPAEKASPAKKTSTAKKTAATKSAPAKKASTAGTTTGRKATTKTSASAAKKSAPTKKSSTAKKSTSASRATTTAPGSTPAAGGA